MPGCGERLGLIGLTAAAVAGPDRAPGAPEQKWEISRATFFDWWLFCRSSVESPDGGRFRLTERRKGGHLCCRPRVGAAELLGEPTDTLLGGRKPQVGEREERSDDRSSSRRDCPRNRVSTGAPAAARNLKPPP